MNLRNVTLELSGKPFFDDREETMYEVGEKLFRQWKSLTDQAEKVSVMLWIADGSEILTYSGNLDATFEWAYWQGCAEALPVPPRPFPRVERAFHHFPHKYRPDAAPRSYRWLKRLIEVLRECCLKINGKELRVVAIFDNGPEFALSDFKYRWHPEICGGSTVGHKRSVICNAHLHGDARHYAAYPDGIPEGTPLGRFLGAQFHLYAQALGYDAIWLSNGMGFGRDAWGITGFLFEKGGFHPENAKMARESMLEFWREFTGACPGMCIETRGSNYSAGIELASDGAPLAELYDQYKIAPPVNSPWAAINYNTGLELAAWMSHIAVLPDERFPYRFYTHDPWFTNSPWLDRYAREPWDIYLPLSIGRITAEGGVQTPDSINLLSVDDSWGRMPEVVPLEVTPHLLEAFRSAPDAPTPFVWVYPFRRYCNRVHGQDPHPETVFSEELFLGETIQAGFPLNTVAEEAYFYRLPATAIAVVPVSAYSKEAEEFLSRGGRIIFYGSLHHAPDALLKTLGLRLGEGVTGRQAVTLAPPTDTFRSGAYANEIFHHDLFNGGALSELADGAKVLAEAGNRVLASINGSAAFVRAVLPQGEAIDWNAAELRYATPDQVFPVETLLRSVAAEFGWVLSYQAVRSSAMLPRLNLSRHDNAFFFNLFARDTTATVKIRTPLGAPLLDDMETELEAGCALWHPARSWHKRCRVLVEQPDGVVSMRILTTEEVALRDRLMVSDLKNAVIRIFLPERDLPHLEMVNASPWEYLASDRMPYEIEETELGRCAVLRNVSGTLVCGILRAHP